VKKRSSTLSPSVLLWASLTLMAGAALAQGQDRRDQAPDQPASSQQQDEQHPQRDQGAAESTGKSAARPETRGGSGAAGRSGAQTAHGHTATAHARAEKHVPETRPQASADQSASIALYRREHPRAAARCRDGFFTTTTDRTRACSKHGGIQIWLLP